MHTFSQLLFDLLKGRTHAFGYRVTMDREPAVLLRLSTLMSETQKVEGLWSALAMPLSPFDGVLPKLNQSSLVLVQLQAKPGKPFVECFQTRGRLVVVFEANHKSSSPGEFHPQALTEPDGNLSAHPALIVQPRDEFRGTIKRTSGAHVGPLGLTSELPAVDGNEIV